MGVFVTPSGEPYRVIGELGAGGFASVLRVEDAAGRQHALKHSRVGGFARRRLLNEADSLRQVDHRHVIRYVAAGCDPEAFVVLELAADGSLQRRLDEAARLGRVIPLATIAALGIQLLDGLAAVHERMIHCDVRASNVLFQETTAKIVDFGSARPLGRADPVGPLDTAALVMPPEGWLGARAAPPGPSYDLYGLGVVLYQLATLRPPFLGTREEMRLQHLVGRPRRPTIYRPDLPEPLESFILQLLQKNPDFRGENARCSRDELAAIAATVCGEPRVDGSSLDPQIGAS